MSREPLALETVDRVFAKFAVRYPHPWASQYGGDGATDDEAMALAAAEWSEVLAGITDAQLRCGFRQDMRRGDHWPPSAPEFAAMCHGIPILAAVRLQLSRHGPRHTRFTRLVWSLLDTYQFSRAEGKHADRLLEDAYRLAVAHVLAGHPLPDEPSGLIEAPPQPRTPAKPETVAATFAALQKVLNVPTEEETAHAQEV